MRKRKLPFKSFLMKQLLDHPEGLTSKELLEMSKPVYGKERQCSVNEIDEMMMGMLSVGFGTVMELSEGENGELEVYYALTDEAYETVKKRIQEMEKA
jgi:hypothetical protein